MTDSDHIPPSPAVVSASALIEAGEREAALRMLETAARQHDAHAANYLGILLLYPDNPSHLEPEAGVAWLSYSFECGAVEAGYWIGQYFDRIGSYSEAFAWYKKAAARGDISSIYRMGDLAVRYGEQVPIDPEQGHALLLDAMHKGHPFAAASLGFAWGTGVFGKRRYFRALKYKLIGAYLLIRLHLRNEEEVRADLLR